MPFTETGRVVLDGSGNGNVRLAQVPQYRRRCYIRVSVSISTGQVSAVTGGEARIYRGEPIIYNFITGTRTPWLDTSTLTEDASEVVHPLQLTVRFTSCDPAAIGTVTATYVEKRT